MERVFLRIYAFILGGGLLLVALFIAIVDPMFHYHAPLNGISYFLNKERYQNDGIVKHFEYNAIVTGTSMAENTKTSEVDRLFGVDSVKTCFMGATYREISDNISVALEHNPSVTVVIRAADLSELIEDADRHISNDPNTEYDFPLYLYDNNPINDLNYLLNFKVLGYCLQDLKMTIQNQPSTTFDEYSNWNNSFVFGKDTVLDSYSRPEKTDNERIFSDEDKSLVAQNLQKNILDIAENNPNVTFYIWIPPYSICYYDVKNRNGELRRTLDALEYEMYMLSGLDNIKLFSFVDCYDIATDLSLYKDIAHYNEDVNSYIVQAMSRNSGRITLQNYKSYMCGVRDFYLNYDYDSIYN